ncbi:hypothetical protein AVEN_23365-1 [Araneus ventricosus]|uniref:Uncharacterized protein n=1 Tax=Araneus ventricosus TaxID=182803 RepID=A0A4Y2NC38_ARAVE|nr:hypothetical protein AVEN_149374-1 [Araneus ventricosus]GBN36549.1 hypothetical protein AVEN_23365-1 [Araneus ventricosus]
MLLGKYYPPAVFARPCVNFHLFRSMTTHCHNSNYEHTTMWPDVSLTYLPPNEQSLFGTVSTSYLSDGLSAHRLSSSHYIRNSKVIPPFSCLRLYALVRLIMTSHGIIHYILYISSPNRDAEKITSFSGIFDMSPKSPNWSPGFETGRQVCRQGQESSPGAAGIPYLPLLP